MIKKAVAEAMDKLSLDQVKNRLVSNLSKGFKQRVGLAQAIVHNPDVLILDEPTEGLDPSQIVHIRELIASLKGQHTILLSSHILSEVQNTCQRMIIIHKGKIIEEGTYDQILDKHQRENGCIVKPTVRDTALADKLRGLEFVTAVQPINEDRLDISLRSTQGENGLDRLLAYFVSNKVSLSSVSSKASSLEEIFIEITH
jgi:ABC-2 type transport system ATP-binding protein